ncbi:MAG: Transposase [Parcubacteria group bacterium GW2011_GWA2_47_7]|nr:MAG: Transposase [Parcubacteria group bacterium GW2011_GWA2_47_7]
MERKISFAPGEYYHVYNRGVDKREIFLSDDDRNRFIKLLYVANGDKSFSYQRIQGVSLDKLDRGDRLVSIGAYCLMSNHFHLLIKEKEDGNISSFMEKLGTSYAMYFNRKYKRSGVLFQNTFKAEHVHRDEHLKYLYAYIHLNPVKMIEPEWKESGIRNLSKAKKYLERYDYSSYADYAMGRREESGILSPDEFPDYFEERGDFDCFVDDWLNFKDEKEDADISVQGR